LGHRCDCLNAGGLDRLNHRLLGFGGAALCLAGSLLGLGDAFADLAQARLALLIFGLELGEPLGFGGAPLGFLGALFDLAQAVLCFRHRPLLRFAPLLQLVLGGLQVLAWARR
jgi:hypothetical protein